MLKRFPPDQFRLPKAVRDLVYLERADDIALFLDDSLRKTASQKLADVDSNGIAVLDGAVVRTTCHPP